MIRSCRTNFYSAAIMVVVWLVVCTIDWTIGTVSVAVAASANADAPVSPSQLDYWIVDQLLSTNGIDDNVGTQSESQNRLKLDKNAVTGGASFNTKKNVAALSPHCWRSAVTLIRQTDQRDTLHFFGSDETTTTMLFRRSAVNSAATLCAALPELVQKRLALEIANCHLRDFGKDLYKDASMAQYCSMTTTATATRASNANANKNDNMNNYSSMETVVPICLQHLTEAGENTYTHYITYLQILCTRRTQELFLQYQQEARDDMTATFASISGQSIETLATMTRLSQTHAEQMETLSEIPSRIQKQITTEVTDHLQETLRVTFDEQVKSQIHELIQSQATEQASFFAAIMDQLQQRDLEHKDRYDEFATYQSSMLLQQTREMERQRRALDEHRKKMQSLSDVVSETTTNMRPLFGLQTLIATATEGYTWITLLLHFLGTFNLLWLVSRPERCTVFRSYLFAIVFAEALLEIALTGAVRYDWVSERERISYIGDLRRWAMIVECTAYIVGMVITCFSVPAHHPSNGNPPPSAQSTNHELERLIDQRLGMRRGSNRSVLNEDRYEGYEEEAVDGAPEWRLDAKSHDRPPRRRTLQNNTRPYIDSLHRQCDFESPLNYRRRENEVPVVGNQYIDQPLLNIPRNLNDCGYDNEAPPPHLEKPVGYSNKNTSQPTNRTWAATVDDPFSRLHEHVEFLRHRDRYPASNMYHQPSNRHAQRHPSQQQDLAVEPPTRKAAAPININQDKRRRASHDDPTMHPEMDSSALPAFVAPHEQNGDQKGVLPTSAVDANNSPATVPQREHLKRAAVTPSNEEPAPKRAAIISTEDQSSS